MIKAIIFDCFGVLTTEGFGVFRNKYFENSPENRSRANKLMDELNGGKVSYDDFLTGLAALSKTSKETVMEYLTENKPNEPLFDYIRQQLKPLYKIGMLSNAGENWLEELFSKEDVELFDDIVLSYEHGLIKPEAGIYLLAAKRLKVEPQECLFIDDNVGHCEGARKVGMQTIHYQDFSQLKKDLERLLKK